MTILTFSEIKLSLRPVKVALLCRSPKSPLRAFIEQLSRLVDAKKVDILLRDFNINALSNEAYAGVSNVLTRYKLMVSEPTPMDGGLLDHLYLMKHFLVRKHVNCTVNIIYFLDHDAVKIHIQKKNREEIDGDIDFAIF